MKTAESVPAESTESSHLFYGSPDNQVIALFVFRRSVVIIEAIHRNAETDADALIMKSLNNDKKKRCADISEWVLEDI